MESVGLAGQRVVRTKGNRARNLQNGQMHAFLTSIVILPAGLSPMVMSKKTLGKAILSSICTETAENQQTLALEPRLSVGTHQISDPIYRSRRRRRSAD